MDELVSSVVRQPGGKADIVPSLVALISEYRATGGTARVISEPFAGSAIIGIGLGLAFPDMEVEIGDRDPSRVALLEAMRTQPNELSERIMGTTPS